MKIYKQFKKQIESIPDDELLKLAQEELSNLRENGWRLRMTIPPRVTDSDILFNEVFRRFAIKRGRALPNT